METKTLKTLNPDEVDETTKDIFSAIEQIVGKLPNLYAAMANSPQLLRGFLIFEETLKQGSFSAKENEAIALVVSQVNDSSYGLAMHSTMAQMLGYSEEEIIDIRRGTLAVGKLKALVTLTKELTKNRGQVSQDTIDEFLFVGYNHKALAELIGMVAIRSITNYVFSNGNFKLDFPKAQGLEASSIN